MDSLIVILLIIGLVSSISKRKKAKQQQQQRARQAGYDEISAVPPPLMREDAPTAKVPEPVKPPKAKKAEAPKPKLPYTKEDWAKLLSNVEVQREQAKDAPTGSLNHKPTEGLHIDAAPVQRLRPDLKHREGESHREHAAHKQRIAEEEARLHREREELKELRNVNLKKLRSAVIMSEVLGKPVALRGRR